MIDDSLLRELKEIGMSEYEAKVYVILSALHPETLSHRFEGGATEGEEEPHE